MREVIRGHQRSSAVIRGHQWSSEVIRGHQRPSVVISGQQRSSEAIRGHQRSSRGHQWSSVVIRGHQEAIFVLEEQTHSKLGSDTRPVTPAECAWNFWMRGHGQLLRDQVYTWPLAAPPHSKGVPPARRDARSAVMGAGVPIWTTSSAENLVLRPPPGGADSTKSVRAREDEPTTIVRPDEGGHQWKMTEASGDQKSQSMAIGMQSEVQSPVVMAPIEVSRVG